jgi:hypothetical protein
VSTSSLISSSVSTTPFCEVSIIRSRKANRFFWPTVRILAISLVTKHLRMTSRVKLRLSLSLR